MSIMWQISMLLILTNKSKSFKQLKIIKHYPLSLYIRTYFSIDGRIITKMSSKSLKRTRKLEFWNFFCTTALFSYFEPISCLVPKSCLSFNPFKRLFKFRRCTSVFLCPSPAPWTENIFIELRNANRNLQWQVDDISEFWSWRHYFT